MSMLDRLFSSLNGCIAYLDLRFHFVQVNQAYAQLTGCTVEELIGRAIFDVFPQSRPKFEPIFQEVVRTGSPHLSRRTSYELVEQGLQPRKAFGIMGCRCSPTSRAGPLVCS